MTALYEAVDMGALERLLEHAVTTAPDPAAITLGFAVDSWDVVITGDGQLRLYGTDGGETDEPGPDGIGSDETESDEIELECEFEQDQPRSACESRCDAFARTCRQ